MTALKRDNQAGFTLLEVLAAIALLSIGSAIFLNTIGYATRALDKDKQTTHLALLAKSVLEEQAVGPLRPGQWVGKIEDIEWQLTSTLTPGRAPVDIYRLDLSVVLGTRKETFVTLRAQRSSVVQR